MKFNKLILLFTIFNLHSFAQIDIRAGMGLDFFSSPSMIDYINQSGFSALEELSSFSTAINFSGEAGIKINDNIQLSGDLAYQIYSYNSDVALGRYNISVNNLMPSILAYYVIEGKGYNLKFGGGAGLRFLSVEQKLPASVNSVIYSTTGFGTLLRAQGNTLLGDKIYANICLDIRYDLNGVPKNDKITLYNNVLKEDVNFNQLILGIKLGLNYKFL